MLDAALHGLAAALVPLNLGFIILGVVLGYVVGILPGLNRPTAIAIALPLTFTLPPVTALCFLIGIAKGSATGGAATAILLNTPGESSSAATCLDGYPLACKGQAEKALKIAVIGSVIGDLAGTTALIAIAQPLARVALAFGPFELTAMLVFALSFVAGLAGRSGLKGLIAAALGVLCATPGIDLETGAPRLTFGIIHLFEGVPIVAVTIGLLALSEMIQQLQEPPLPISTPAPDAADRSANRVAGADLRNLAPTLVRSSLIGVIVGIIPGLGASVGSFMAYAAEQRLSRTPERFGQGAMEGVAAAEAADNAVVPASIVPLLALGVPGSVAAALLSAAFLLHGIIPGPMLFAQHPDLIGSIYAGMIVAAVVMLCLGWPFLKLLAPVAALPRSLVVPVVLALCFAGAYLEGSSMFGVYVMLLFGLLGYLMRLFEFSLVTFLIGFIVGPLLEHALRQSLIIADGRWEMLLAHPIALALLALAVSNALLLGRAQILAGRRRTPEPPESGPARL